MFTTKHLLYFLSGAAFFHTLGHIAIIFTNLLPMNVFGIEFTTNLNYITIAISGLITVALLYFANNAQE